MPSKSTSTRRRPAPSARYFPVDVPPLMPGRQPRLGSEGAGTTCFERDQELSEYLAAKTPAVRAPGAAADEARVVDWLRDTIAREHPDVAIHGRTLDEVMPAVQEDLVVMRRPSDVDAADAIAAYLHVSFPTGWCPDCACGRSFLDIHAPVPERHAFAASNRWRLAQSLFGVDRRATVRFVWTVTPDPRLDRRKCPRGLHPSVTASWDGAPTAWFRVERQVIVPLSDALGVFLIRVYRHDVRALSAAQRDVLRRSIAAMDRALAAYKGLAEHAGTIDALLA
jgi:hypothetical protein